MQSTSRSALNGTATSEASQPVGLGKLLRLVSEHSRDPLHPWCAHRQGTAARRGFVSACRDFSPPMHEFVQCVAFFSLCFLTACEMAVFNRAEIGRNRDITIRSMRAKAS